MASDEEGWPRRQRIVRGQATSSFSSVPRYDAFHGERGSAWRWNSRGLRAPAGGGPGSDVDDEERTSERPLLLDRPQSHIQYALSKRRAGDKDSLQHKKNRGDRHNADSSDDSSSSDEPGSETKSSEDSSTDSQDTDSDPGKRKTPRHSRSHRYSSRSHSQRTPRRRPGHRGHRNQGQGRQNHSSRHTHRDDWTSELVNFGPGGTMAGSGVAAASSQG